MLYSLFATAATVSVWIEGSATVVVFEVGREEFINREVDSLECITGVLGVTAAFLGGYAEIISGDKHLYVAFKLNNCENAKSNLDSFFALATESALKAVAYV
jgi:hypothetical protein